MSFNFIIFPGCMKRASGPGAGSWLPALLWEGVQDPGAGSGQPRGRGVGFGGAGTRVSPCPAPRRGCLELGMAKLRASTWGTITSSPVMLMRTGPPSQFGDPCVLGGHRDWLRGSPPPQGHPCSCKVLGWWSTGPGCPGRLWSLLLWRYSRPPWTSSSTDYR